MNEESSRTHLIRLIEKILIHSAVLPLDLLFLVLVKEFHLVNFPFRFTLQLFQMVLNSYLDERRMTRRRESQWPDYLFSFVLLSLMLDFELHSFVLFVQLFQDHFQLFVAIL